MFYRLSCIFLFCSSLFGVEHLSLKTPAIRRENRIGTNVGNRPFRRSGVRLEAEYIQSKLFIHNYGYGGSGLTLSFGGSKEVLDILDRENNPSKVVAVLGAGVVGLAVAYDLLERGYEVHLYADEWSPNLTSNVAAGIWTPLEFPADLSEEKKALHQRMLESSRCRFLKSIGDHYEFAGVRLIYSYFLQSPDNQGKIKEMCGEEVMIHFDNGVIKQAKRIHEIGIEGKLFMEDLFSKVKERGARLECQHFDSLEDLLHLEEPIIINCTSMGSRQLFNDQEFIPVRGHIVYFKPQDGVDCFFQNFPHNPGDPDHFFFMLYPWNDRLILGGVYEYGQEEPLVHSEIIDTIIENGERCLSGDL